MAIQSAPYKIASAGKGKKYIFGALFNKVKKISTGYSFKFFKKQQFRLKNKGFVINGREFTHHTTLKPEHTAAISLSRNQKILGAALIAGFVMALLLNWHGVLEFLLAIFTVVYFFDVLFNLFLVFQSLTNNVALEITELEMAMVPETAWPTYTIFCPLYKEAEVVPQFVTAMKRLDYPKNKLQILFLLEEDDNETKEKIKLMDLPQNFRALVIPHSLPKTKPKAMNYGLYFARGKFTVVFDAEDVPDPDQLKKAILAFTKSPVGTVCVQAKLNFYNPKQNLLTKVFTAEYSLWFDLILPGLQSVAAPIPLGGTSNHFRTADLKRLQGWDAFNVTEDCDLGIRLAKQGYKTAIFNSTTWEEANSEMKNWYRQRSRWVKGYMQTFLVNMRQWRVFFQNHQVRDLLFFQMTVGGKVASVFINPFMWGMTALYFIFRPTLGHSIESFFPAPLLYMAVFSFIFGNFFYLYHYMIGCAKRGFDGLIKYTLLVPFYWLGMSFSAWKALLEIIVKPHYWAKTQHGLHIKLKKIEDTEQELGPPLSRGVVFD